MPKILVRKKKTKAGQPERYVFVLVNLENVVAGDRILLRAAPGIELSARGPAARAATYGRADILYVYGEGNLRIAVCGKPRAGLTAVVSLPQILQPQGGLLGPLMPHLAVPESKKRHPLDAYFLALDGLVVAADCNYMSICPIAYWNDLDIGSPFTLIDGRRDLSEIDPLFEGAFRCLLWRAARAGVAVHLYPFEFVSFNHPGMWARSPLYAPNNIHGWIDEAAPRGYKGFHRILKDCEPQAALEILCDYFRRLCGMIDTRHPHTVVPVLEGQSRRVDINLSANRLGRPLGINQKSLYRDHAWPAMEQHLTSDSAWRGLLRDAALVSCHSCDSGGVTARILARLKPFALDLNFSLLASTDGTGAGCGELSRYRRPRGTRPNLDDLIEIWREGRATAGDRFLGLEIKTTDWDDAQEILAAVRECINAC
ncbi:MAG TPA: hypothetical protein VMX35_04100 [Acidobacteriota bacterium]|nr:hypothetical protein [Acidobacteriota bacterium]